MNKFNKGIVPLIAIIVIVAFVLIGGGAAYYYYANKIQSTVQIQQINTQSPSNNSVVTKTNPPISTNTSTQLSLDEINNLTYPQKHISGEGSQSETLTLTNGKYQSGKILCEGVKGACPRNQYLFAKLDKYAFNEAKNQVAVLIVSSYADNFSSFENTIHSTGAESIALYVVMKNQNGKINFSSAYNLGWGYQIDQNVNSLVITNITLNNNKPILSGKAKKNDGYGNFTDIIPIFTFKFESNNLSLLTTDGLTITTETPFVTPKQITINSGYEVGFTFSLPKNSTILQVNLNCDSGLFAYFSDNLTPRSPAPTNMCNEWQLMDLSGTNVSTTGKYIRDIKITNNTTEQKKATLRINVTVNPYKVLGGVPSEITINPTQ